MSEVEGISLIELVFQGRSADQHQLPASVLAQTLEGLQRVVHLLAMQHEGVEVRQRDRVSGSIEGRYVLLCSPPVSGSFAIQAQIGDPASALVANPDVAVVTQMFVDAGRVFAASDYSRLNELVPDHVRRNRVVEAYRSVIPREGSGLSLEVRNGNGSSIFTTSELAVSVKKFAATAKGEHAVQTVTGSLSKIDFDEHKLTIVHPVTHRDLDCFYDESVEDLLLKKPRELIQVTGKVILDEDDQPKRITEVEDIREVDLSPFFVDEFQSSGRLLRFRHPLTLLPELDDTQQLMCLEESDLGIDVFAPTRELLEQELHGDLDLLWRNYALAEDEQLTPDAQRLKANFLAAVEEVRDAT